MQSITDEQYKEYETYLSDRVLGYVISSDGILHICESNDNNAEKIGLYILDKSKKIQEKRDKTVIRNHRKLSGY